MKKFLTMMLLCIASPGFAQQLKVEGTVTDKSSRTPVTGATIISQKQVVISDSTGHFSLKADAKEIITISCMGMNTITVPVPASGKLVVELSANIADLNQVVITGYQTQRKADLTGAVSVVNVGDLKKQAVASPIKALQGQVPGVFITSSGSPSAPVTVRIRGVGTLNDNDPLYIIDGVPTKSGLHELNSSDIETMQVLKDASAASIYGARAANGVIIITTKQGRSGRMMVNVNAYTAVQTYTTKPKMLNAGGYGQAYWQAAVNTGRDPNANNLGYNYQWHVEGNGTPVLDKILLPEFIDGDRRTMRTANTNWFDAISQTGVVQSYDLSVSNGTEKGNYLFSLGYFDNKGVIKTTGFNRLSARMNANYKMLQGRLQIGENFTINRTKEVQDPGVLNLSLQALPIVPVHTVDGKGWGGPWGGMNDRQNPVRLLMDNQQNGYKYLRIFGNVYADLSIIKGLNLRTSAGVDYGNYLADNFLKKYQSGYLVGNENQLTMNYSNSSRVTWTNTLNYNRTFGKHLVNAVAGTEFYKQNDESFWASRKNFAIEDPSYTYLDAGTGEKNNGGGGAINALISYFGKVNYTYASRYLASFTLRRDGSSRFGASNQFGTFPAFSLGWRLSQEEFFRKNVPAFISDLKLRYGWGQTGNQEISNVGAYSIYLTDYNGTSYDLGGTNTGTLPSGYHITQRGNDLLKWEATTMSNYGVDFGFWEQKLTGSFEYFTKNTSDILVLPPYIAVLGEAGNQWVNGASMENKGWEFALTYNGQVGAVEFQASGNISGYRNKVTKLPESVVNNYGGNGLNDNILGRAVNSYYGYVTDGLFRTQKEVDESANQLGKGLGRIRYKDLNNDGMIDDRDRTWIGTPHPDFIYGLNLAVQWKNFDFSAFFQGVQGNAVINDVKYNTDFWSVRETGSNKGSRLLDAWSPQHPNSSIPALSATDNNFESRFSTYFVEKGDYLKLRNIQLGYSFSKQLLNSIHIQKLRVYAGGDNVWLLHKNKSFTGLDPENPGFGYPNPAVFTGGLNVTF
ncbi:TonB-dependent receptor [Chitinophaga varians]|uniref:TonB-dependent receptor n=1 Tax=Chitinophaga varians TaxID=2202339 RepID=A0A847S265_9BACT|nr:TonB-dependent receptor [Chitinophaga varians]NLR67525.1 TonB-dependent receptor [Chitinophaga varians]